MSLFYEKPFVKSISSVDSQETIVQLVDTSGNFLPSTHITVKASTDNETFGYFWVTPVQGQGDYFDVSSGSTDLDNVTASGRGAAGDAGMGRGIVELFLNPKYPVTEIKILNKLRESANFIITYGNRFPLGPNSLKGLSSGS